MTTLILYAINGCTCSLLYLDFTLIDTVLKRRCDNVCWRLLWQTAVLIISRLCATACLISYVVWPNEFIFIAFFLCLDKCNVEPFLCSASQSSIYRCKTVYFNSLLATLNSRESLQENLSGLSDVPIASGYSQATASRMPTDIFSLKSSVSHNYVVTWRFTESRYSGSGRYYQSDSWQARRQ